MASAFSYTEFKTLKDCPKKYQVHFLGIDEKLGRQETFRQFIGSVVQHILELAVINKINMETYQQFCDDIDKDLKKVKTCIYDLCSEKKDEEGNLIEKPDFHAYEDNKYIKSMQTCYAGTSKGYIIWIAQNSIIKKIRDFYKPVLQTLIEKFGSYEIETEKRYRYQLTDDILISGTLDFKINKLVDGLMIIDGKMNNKEGLVSSDQMVYYSIVTGEPEKVTQTAIWDYTKNEITEYPINETIINNLKEEIVDRYTKLQGYIAAGEFPKTPSYTSCLFCQYVDNCDKKKQEESQI